MTNSGEGLRRLSAVLATLSLAAATLFAWGVTSADGAGALVQSGGATRSETITRTHLIDGKNQQVDKRTVHVTLSNLDNLRDRQGVDVSWSGAHPTGGVVFDVNTGHAADQEYPVVILQCRGVDSASVPARNRLTPATCFTQTPETRYQGPYRGAFPAYRVDRYASAADRDLSVGTPNPLPSKCIDGDGAQHWVPFVAADGTRYNGGYDGCAGLAPEQSIVTNPLAPSNETFGTTRTDGTGNARFIVQDAQDNASLGCSAGVACALVVIPIMGISCDAAGAALPRGSANRPAPSDVQSVQSECMRTGFYAPGTDNGNQTGSDPNSQVSVNGQLWWSASNWRNRMTFPITFAPTAASCPIVTAASPENIYGSQYMLQATQQWAPKFCTDTSLFPLQHTQTSEVQAKNLLASGVTAGHYLGVKAAFQAGPPATPFRNPIVQAPTAVSGFAIGYVMDDATGHQYTQLRLDARLLAKLLTMSYPALPDIKNDWATSNHWKRYRTAGLNNPLDMGQDPEFLALNPGMKLPSINQLFGSSTLFAMSSDSDVMSALTSYINADPEARAWLDGKPDPWGMVVNPKYKRIKLPVDSWPLKDKYYNSLGNECIADNHLPVLPLIAGPVSDPAQITFNMQFGIENSQLTCSHPEGTPDEPSTRKLSASGPQQPGIRFLLGIVSVADAARYQIDTAALQTQNSNPDAGRFTDASGRSFARPTVAAMTAAAKMFRPDDALGTWPVPYDSLRTEAAGRGAYPGTMLMSTDVPTAGLLATDARNYAKFLRYVAGPGQVPGSANGDLAGGYAPITAANGLGNLATYTVDAADAVARQRGFVPKPSAPVVQSHPSTHQSAPPTSPTSGQPVGGNGSSSGSRGLPGSGSDGSFPPQGSVGPTPAVGGAGGISPEPGGSAVSASPQPSSSRASSSGPSAGTSQQPQNVAEVYHTPDTKPGWTAAALPALAIIALLSGVLAAVTSRIRRQ